MNILPHTEEIKSEDVENLLKEVKEMLQKLNELIKQFKEIEETITQ